MKRYICLLTAFSLTLCMLGGCKRAEDNEQATAHDVDTVTEQQTGGTTNTQTPVTPEPEKQTQDTQSQTQTKPQTQTPAVTKPSYTYSDDADTEDIADLAPEEEVTAEPEKSDEVITPEYKDNVGTNARIVEITNESYNLKQLGLPKVNITTYNGGKIVSTSEYIPANISIDNTEAQYTLKSTSVDIRGRGNSTWSEFDKKPYKLRFPLKTDLFGMGAQKKWVLFACGCMDETMMRNVLAYDLAKRLGVEFTTDYRYVNLFLNGDYKGVYLLLEQQEEGEHRVDVNTSKEGEVDTGYFLEMWNNNWETIDKPYFENPYVNGVQSTAKCVIISPGKKIITDDQYNYIKDYVIKTNEAILKKDWDKIIEYIDVSSFVNMFLVDTVFLNNDSGYSYYMYKKAGEKLCLGPIWDIDQSAGNSSHGGSSWEGWNRGSTHDWYRALMDIPQFREEVRLRYIAMKDEIRGIVDRVDKIATENAYDFAMSNFVYNNFGNEARCRTMPEIVALKTYPEHLAYLRTWFTNRLLWMEANLAVE